MVIMFMYLAIDILMNLLFLLSALFLIKKNVSLLTWKFYNLHLLF